MHVNVIPYTEHVQKHVSSELGFEYVTEMDGVKLFRKPKGC